MKLLVVAALIAVCSGGRLEHLERSYLPPDGSGAVGSSSSDSGGISGNQNSAFSGPQSRQYLPPKQGNTGSTSNGLTGGSSINSACLSCGSFRYPGDHHSQSSQSSAPTTSYGDSQLGSSNSPNGFRSTADSNSGSAFSNRVPSESSFGSPSQESRNYESQGATSGQYVAPAVSSQKSRQQPFEQKSGSSFGSTNGFGSASGPDIASSVRSSGSPSSSSFASPSGAQGSGNYGFQGAASRQYSAPESLSQNSRQQLFDQKIASPSLDSKRFGSTPSSSSGSSFNNFGSPSGSSLGYSSGTQETRNYESQGTTSRQYLAPAVTSQNSRPQPFKQKSGSTNGFGSASGSGIGSRVGNFGATSGSSFGSLSVDQGSDNYESVGATSRQYSAPEVSSQNSRQQPFNQKSGSFSGSTNGFGSSGFFSGSADRTTGTSSSSSFSSLSTAQNDGSQGATSRQYLAPATSFQRSTQQPFDEKSGYIY